MKYIYYYKKEILLSLMMIFIFGCAGPQKNQTKKKIGYAHPLKPKNIKSNQPSPKNKPKRNKSSYSVNGQVYHPHQEIRPYEQVGIASWYGPNFHGRPTASGEIFDMYKLSAAHKILPLQSKVMVTNLENGKSLILRINDRGPFVKNRIIDLSYGAAKKLGVVGPGTAKVRVRSLGAWDKDIRGNFFIQINSFAKYDNARMYKNRLQAKGYEKFRIKKVKIDGSTFWRVQAGAFQSLKKAEELLFKFRKENPSSFIIAD